jgi:hypothetical protein
MSTMTEIIAEHLYSTVRPRNYMLCYCGYRPDHASEWAGHVAEELAKTGYGNMADAWAEGFTDCANEHTFQRIDATHPITRTNPYRGAGHE